MSDSTAHERVEASSPTTVLLIGVSLLALFTVVIPFVLGAQSYTVLTGSMRPGFEPGTLIAVRATDPEEIRIGDVITYQLEPGRPEVVTHRVVGVNVRAGSESTFTTRGDANNVNDSLPVLPVQVRGVVVFAVPVLGHVNLFFQGAEKSLLVFAVGIGAIGYGVVVLGRETMRSRRQKRRRASAATSVVVLIATCAVALGPPTPAGAEDRTDVSAAEVLALSTDGTTWVRDGSIDLFGASDAVLVPGKNTTTRLWIRNESGDSAAFALTASWGPPASATAGDIALADDLTISFNGTPAIRDVEWNGDVVAPGDTRSIEVSVTLAAASGNDTRRGATQVSPTVRLTQMVMVGVLATTGGALPLGLALLAALAALSGLALVTRRRTRRITGIAEARAPAS